MRGGGGRPGVRLPWSGPVRMHLCPQPHPSAAPAAFLGARGQDPTGSELRSIPSHFPTEAPLQGCLALCLMAEVAHLACRSLLAFLPNALLCIDSP